MKYTNLHPKLDKLQHLIFEYSKNETELSSIIHKYIIKNLSSIIKEENISPQTFFYIIHELPLHLKLSTLIFFKPFSIQKIHTYFSNEEKQQFLYINENLISDLLVFSFKQDNLNYCDFILTHFNISNKISNQILIDSILHSNFHHINIFNKLNKINQTTIDSLFNQLKLNINHQFVHNICFSLNYILETIKIKNSHIKSKPNSTINNTYLNQKSNKKLIQDINIKINNTNINPNLNKKIKHQLFENILFSMNTNKNTIIQLLDFFSHYINLKKTNTYFNKSIKSKNIHNLTWFLKEKIVPTKFNNNHQIIKTLHLFFITNPKHNIKKKYYHYFDTPTLIEIKNIFYGLISLKTPKEYIELYLYGLNNINHTNITNEEKTYLNNYLFLLSEHLTEKLIQEIYQEHEIFIEDDALHLVSQHKHTCSIISNYHKTKQLNQNKTEKHTKNNKTIKI